MSLIYTADSSVAGGRRHSLYIGGRSEAKNRDKLEQRGITHIVNVTPTKDSGIQSGVPNFFGKSGKFVYKRVPVYDASTSDLLEYADGIVNFIAKGLCHGSVLVHCNHGVSRSTTCALFYLIRKANLSLTDALQMVRRRRPEAEPIPAFRAQLEKYELRCIQERGEDERREVVGKKTTSTLPEKKRQLQPSTGPDSSSGVRDKQKRSKIGPAMGPPSTSRSIGPAMPPPPLEDKFTSIGATTSPSEGEVQHKQQAIGPTLPPSADGNSGKSNEAQAKTKAVTSIGPSLPPSSAEQPTSTETKKQTTTIGPSLPPSK